MPHGIIEPFSKKFENSGSDISENIIECVSFIYLSVISTTCYFPRFFLGSSPIISVIMFSKGIFGRKRFECL